MTVTSDPLVTRPTASPTRSRSLVIGRLARRQEFGPSVGLLVTVAVFTILSANFWSPNNLTAITTIASTVGIVAIGVTMLMISGEFDLSVGEV